MQSLSLDSRTLSIFNIKILVVSHETAVQSARWGKSNFPSAKKSNIIKAGASTSEKNTTQQNTTNTNN